MFPSISSRNPIREFLGNAVLSADIAYYFPISEWAFPSVFAKWIASANINGLFLGQASHWIPFSNKRPTSDDTIPAIVSGGSGSSVFRIYARRIITAMEQMLPPWNPASIYNLPSHPMSAKHPNSIATPDYSISTPVLIANPQPAFSKTLVSRMHRAILINLIPESIFHRNLNELSFCVDFHRPKYSNLCLHSRGVI